jgi:hypothetical protein
VRYISAILNSVSKIKRAGLLLAGSIFAFFSQSCDFSENVGDGPIPAENEVVMTPGMEITADTPSGEIKVTAGNGLKRSYTWDGETRSVEMRTRKRKEGRDMGIYFPGPGEHWKENHGVTRGVLQEGRLNFNSEEAALKWLSEKPAFIPRVYRRDGLSVWFAKAPSRRQINVDVFQVYIGNSKPKQLPGAQDENIQVNLDKKQ